VLTSIGIYPFADGTLTVDGTEAAAGLVLERVMTASPVVACASGGMNSDNVRPPTVAPREDSELPSGSNVKAAELLLPAKSAEMTTEELDATG
jgi:hypothetical protein